MIKSLNYELNVPELDDQVNLAWHNQNTIKIDKLLKEQSDKTDNINTTLTDKINNDVTVEKDRAEDVEADLLSKINNIDIIPAVIANNATNVNKEKIATETVVNAETTARENADNAIINGTTPVQKVAPNANTWDFNGGTQLPDKVDMKTIKTPGTYHCLYSVSAPTDTPENMKGAGILKVYSSIGYDTPKYLTQEWTIYNKADLLARRLTENDGQTWTDWQIFEGVGLNDKMATQNWVQDEATAFGAKYLVDRGNINSAFTPNEAIEDGIYYRWGGNGTANMPYGLDSAGILMTKAIHSNKDFIAQIYLELSSRAMFLRSKYTGKWQDWLMIDNLSSGILIKDNSNLNDYINPGIYVSPRSDNHIKNNPVKGYGAGRLRVYQSVGNHSYITQKWEKLGGSSIYTRYCTLPDSIWSHWYKFEGVNMGV